MQQCHDHFISNLKIDMIISNGEWGVKTETKQLENDLSSFD